MAFFVTLTTSSTWNGDKMEIDYDNNQCKCKYGYTGAICDKCATGYTGDSCNTCDSDYIKSQNNQDCILQSTCSGNKMEIDSNNNQCKCRAG